MKKLIIAAAITLSLYSCNKDKKECYDCVNSYNAERTIECETYFPTQDANGNDLNCMRRP